MKLGPAIRAFLAEEQARELDEAWEPNDPRWRWDVSRVASTETATAKQSANERTVLLQQSRKPR